MPLIRWLEKFNEHSEQSTRHRRELMAEQLVSFDEVKRQISIVDVLRHYGFLDALQQKGDQLVGLCPFHKEGKPSFKVTPARNIWHCFSGACGNPAGGDIIDLVCAAERISMAHRNSARRRAALLLQERFDLTPPAPAQESTKESRAPQHRKQAGRTEDDQEKRDEAKQQANAGPESTLPAVINPALGFTLKNLDYERAYEYAEMRGIHRTTAEQFGLAVALAGGYKGRLVIPLLDYQDGQEVLVGYAARALDESEPKYLFPSREKGFKKSHLVYNLAHMRAHRAAVVVEGFFDCMKVSQAGFPVVAILGSDMSTQQAELLCAHFERMVLFFDGDAAGRQGTDRALVEIGRRGRYVRAVMLPDGLQPDQLAEAEIRRLLRR
jgi:DNA primase